MSGQFKYPVIIAGGGLVGLTMAQALERDGIPYLLYERDESIRSRYGGWGITLHWCVPALRRCLTTEAFAAIQDLHNDPRTLSQDKIPYRFWNLETGEAKTEDFGAPHLRVSRFKLREVLSRGLSINWNTSVDGWEPVEDGVLVKLSNGETVKGCFIAVAEGKNSKIKRQLVGEDKSKLYTFPMGFVGLKMRLTPEQIAPFRALSPIFFHGCHPNGKFVFFSTVSTPDVNGSKGKKNEHFEMQLNLSWIIGDETSTVPSMTDREKLQAIKNAATEDTGFFKQLRDAFGNIPDDAEVLDIKLQDWIPEPWPSSPVATLLGDAVHPMTMFRGEAANHGIFDAYTLARQLQKVKAGEKSVAEALHTYETEMVIRAKEAVILSRKAGFEVHDIENISPSSALFCYPQVARLSSDLYD